MLWIKLTGGGGDIHGYLTQGDYYSKGDRVTGASFGKTAKALGLIGAVNLQDFEKCPAIERSAHRRISAAATFQKQNDRSLLLCAKERLHMALESRSDSEGGHL